MVQRYSSKAPTADKRDGTRYNCCMTRQVEAVFEHGVLRPLEPLALPEMQRVLVTITDVPASEEPSYYSRKAEQDWLRQHEREYAGQWVALEGSVLLSHGSDAIEVRDAARKMTSKTPLFVHISKEPALPSAGWW
jgi:predicted DNA-binding antitoxin AbrB/MazE fold protein